VPRGGHVLLLSPWIADPTALQRLTSTGPTQLLFEFEQRDDYEEHDDRSVAGRMRDVVNAVVSIAESHGAPLVSPTRARPSRGWVVPPLADDARLVLSMLTSRSVSTAVEATYLATKYPLPQICVGIDVEVPPPLGALPNVMAVGPDHTPRFVALAVDSILSIGAIT
jgi:hypothetical protein